MLNFKYIELIVELEELRSNGLTEEEIEGFFELYEDKFEDLFHETVEVV